jgi:type I restriction enzyme M protein
VAAQAELFAAHGFDPLHLLVERDARHFEFRPELNGNGDLKARIEGDAGVKGKEKALADAFDAWWAAQRGQVEALPETKALMALRAELLASFGEALVSVGLLDRFGVAGAVATWWGEVVFDLKALMAGGFEGVVEGWVTTILTALEDGGGKGTPLDHKLVKRLLPEYLDEIAEVEGKVAELDGTIKAATASGDDDEDGDGGGDDDEALSEAEIKALKKKLSAAKAKLKTLHKGFSDRLEAAQDEVDGDEAEALVLDILKADLRRELDRRVVAHRQAVVAAVEGWWRKYRVTLRAIEGERDAAKGRLDGFLKELGYVG